MCIKNWPRPLLLTILLMTAWILSCSKKMVETDLSAPLMGEDATLQATEQSELEELQRQWSLEESHRKAATAEQEFRADRETFMDEDIYFDKDSSSLLPEAQVILKRKAQWLKQNPQVSAIIQGRAVAGQPVHRH